MISNSFDINSNGHLTIGGVDSIDLAKKYGTPMYAIDEDAVRNNCALFRESIKEYYDGNGLCVYASKAFCCKEICKVIAEENCGLDVVSGGEIYTALKAGFPMDKVFFHGNNKTYDEIKFALESKVGRIIVDNLTELKMLNALCEELSTEANIYFRVKPGVDAHTHDFIRTGQIDSKFGFAYETGEALDAIRECINYERVNLVGLHCHIGSQIFDIEPFVTAANIMIDFMKEAKDKLGVTLSELDLGGGFGIKYTDSDTPIPYDAFMGPVADKVKSLCEEYGMSVPKIIIEPGRSIIAPAGATLYTVGNVKTIPNIRTYVSIDGGMGDNPRYILYGSKYELLCANKASEPKDTVVTVAGKCCESGDLIQENAPLQKVEAGDIVAVLATGAYNYSMASNYNRIPRLPVVFVKNGEDRLVIRRETYEDIISCDL